jgi:hypothetical protein
MAVIDHQKMREHAQMAQHSAMQKEMKREIVREAEGDPQHVSEDTRGAYYSH